MKICISTVKEKNNIFQINAWLQKLKIYLCLLPKIISTLEAHHTLRNTAPSWTLMHSLRGCIYNSQPSAGSVKSLREDEPKEEHTKTHGNQNDKNERQK